MITPISNLAQLITDNDEILTHLCVKGLLPSIIEMICATDFAYTIDTKLYVVWLIKRVVSSESTLTTFVSCCGLPLLVELLEPDYSEDNKQLIRNTVDCIYLIIDTHGNVRQLPKEKFDTLFRSISLKMITFGCFPM